MNIALPCEFKTNFITSSLTTFRIGGPADVVAWPKNAQELIATIQWAKKNNFPITFLGGGSNVLISDKGVRGLLIVTSAMNHISSLDSGLEVECGAGCNVQELVFWSAENNLSGLEFAGGLPGSIGGAIWMNARAYGGEFSEIVTMVEAVNDENQIENFNKSQMNFSYKQSIFQTRKLFITKCKIQLKKGDKKEILEKAMKNIEDRRAKKQDQVYSAGCVFKNNYSAGIPTGKLIQDAGLKGFTIGGARIFEEHANFVINANEASAKDVIAIMRTSQLKVKEKFGIDIFPELQFIGDFSDTLLDLKFS